MPTPDQAEQRAKDQFTTATKVFMALLWVIPGALVGAVVRLFALPTEFGGLDQLLWQYLPWMAGFAGLFAAFAWICPNFSAWLFEALLDIEFSRI